MTRLHEPDGPFDYLHDSDVDCSWPRDLTPDQAECARILGWTKRMTTAQWRVLTQLCDWHNAGTSEKRTA